MKNQLANRALEGTYNSDVVGGFAVNRGKPSGAFVFILPRIA